MRSLTFVFEAIKVTNVGSGERLAMYEPFRRLVSIRLDGLVKFEIVEALPLEALFELDDKDSKSGGVRLVPAPEVADRPSCKVRAGDVAAYRYSM
jgi:hypothetical protein